MNHSLSRLPALPLFVALAAAMVGSLPAQIQQVWTRSYEGSFSTRNGIFSVMALDGQSNVCVTGTAEGDFKTVKYSPAGSLLWSNRFDGGSVETAETIAADALGAVWVSGISLLTNGTRQRAAIVVKYDAGGGLSWTQRFESNVLSTALAVDSVGNAYVAGALLGGFLYVAKYASGGSELWARTFQSVPGWFMEFGGVALDGAGNVVVSGLATELNTFTRRSVLVKFDSAGTRLWSNEVLPYVGGGTARTVALSQDGDGYVSGDSLLAAKVEPDGVVSWTKSRSGSLPTFASLQVDPAGNLVVAGTDTHYHPLCADCGEGETIYQLFRTKLSPSGAVLWPERSYTDFGFGYLQFDADGSCYLGGPFSTRSDDQLPPHPDAILVKFAPDGSELWRTNFSTGQMTGMKVDGAGNVYVLDGGFSSVAIRKFVQPAAAPVIRFQPQSLAVLDGGNASLSVSGTGFPSPLFQWRFNGTSLPNETNGTLTLTAVHSNQAGNYTVMLSNSLGSVTSTVATLTVNLAAPTVTARFTQGETQVFARTTVVICAQATGGPPPVLQWRLNGNDLPGQTNACLTLDSVQVNQSGTYRVVASNSLGTASAFVSLTVQPAWPDFELEPPQWSPGVGMRLSFEGVLSRIYQIQASTNLVNWTEVLTFTNQAEYGEWTDTNALRWPWRFYRLVEP